ncbi:unnamed protein product, partial [Prorocentrum cordatum]
ADPRSQKRALARVRWGDRTVNQAVSALNGLYLALEGSAGIAFAAHREAHHQLRLAARLSAQGSNVFQPRAAVGELLRFRSLYDEGAACLARACDVELVGIPRLGSAPPALVDVVDPVGQEMQKDWANTMLLDQDEWGRAIESSPPITPFMDVELRWGPALYRGFIGDLRAAGLLAFTAEPKTADSREELFVSSLHINISFYALKIPPELMPFFCLPAAPEDFAESFGEPLVALGMGPSVALADPGPIPDISEGMPTVLAYCGNIGVASTSCKSADSPRAKIEAQLVADGFEVHEATAAPIAAAMPGRGIDGRAGAAQLTARRRAKLEAALRRFDRRTKVSARQVGVIIGRCIDAAMLNPCTMSAVRRRCDFVAAAADKRARLWAAAPWESSVMRRLLFACAADMRRPCCAAAGVHGSSLTQTVFAAAEAPADGATGIGRVGERSRFKRRHGALLLRFSALGLPGDPFSDPRNVAPCKPR